MRSCRTPLQLPKKHPALFPRGGILSEFGEVGVDCDGVVVVAAERLTDEFSQLISSEIHLFIGLMAYTDQV
jgi:hypothetical protein